MHMNVLLPALTIAWLATRAHTIPTAINKKPQQQQDANCGFINAQRHNNTTLTSNTSFLEMYSTTEDKPLRMPRGSKLKFNCQCLDDVRLPANDKLVMDIPIGHCAATDVKIVKLTGGSGMEEGDVEDVIGNPLNISWATIKYHHFSDWQPRTDSKVMSTPGGDLIEYINMLSVYEDVTGARFRWWHCRWLMYRYLQTTKKLSFYMSTDSTAIRQLSGYVDLQALDLRLRPSNGRYWRTMRALLLPELNGCDILSGMLKEPKTYGLRRGLPECAIIGFYMVLWNKWRLEGKKLRVVEMDPMAKAKAVLNVKASKSCTEMGLTPIIPARTDDFAYFTNFPDAVQVYRGELRDFLCGLNSRVNPTDFLNRMNANGAKWTGIEQGRLAKGIPVYNVHIL